MKINCNAQYATLAKWINSSIINLILRKVKIVEANLFKNKQNALDCTMFKTYILISFKSK